MCVLDKKKTELPGSRICFQVFSHSKYSPIIILVSLLPSLLRARHTWSGESAMWIIPYQLSAQRIITNNCLRFCLKQGCRWKVALALYAWIAESSVCNCHALTNSKRPFFCFPFTLQLPTYTPVIFIVLQSNEKCRQDSSMNDTPQEDLICVFSNIIKYIGVLRDTVADFPAVFFY